MTGEELKKRRLAMDISQADLANVIGINVMTISRYERGILKIPAALIFAFKILDKYQAQNKV